MVLASPRARLVAALIGLGVTQAPLPAAGFCRSRTGPGQPDPSQCPDGGAFLAWRERCAGVVLDPRVLPPGIDLATVSSVVDAAAQAWQSARCDAATGAAPSFALVPLDVASAPVGYVPGQHNVNTIAFRDHWGDDANHPAGVTAITVVTYDAATGQIFDADTELNLRAAGNPDGFLFDTAGNPAAADLQTVMTHELGHAQGLAHSANTTAVMWFAAGRTFAQRALTPDDEAAICAVAPPAPTTSCDPMAAGNPRPVTAASCGCTLVSSHGDGRRAAVAALLLGSLIARSRRARRSR